MMAPEVSTVIRHTCYTYATQEQHQMPTMRMTQTLLDSLTVRGAITNSVVGAGVNPVDGIFGNGNDQIEGGTSSIIKRLAAASADSASRFEAGAFGTVRLPAKVNPATDPRFVS